MLAVELQRFSDSSGLVPVERPDPEPGPGEVRVDLVAASQLRDAVAAHRWLDAPDRFGASVLAVDEGRIA